MEKVIGIEVKGEVYRIEDEETSGKTQTLETKVATAEENIENLETAATEQAEKVANIETNIGNVDISELSETVAGHTDELTEISEEIPNIKSSVEELTPVLLWTNPKPNLDFDAQTINLNLTDYKKIKVVYRDKTSPLNNQYSVEGEFIATSIGLNLQSMEVDWGDDTLYVHSRMVRVNKLQVIFSEATTWVQTLDGARDTQNTAQSVPLKIYGYK